MLSIDFGTSSVAAAYRDTMGGIRAIPLSSTGSTMPSAALYTTGRMLLVGEAAVQAAATEPQAFEPAPKRKIPEPEVPLAGMFVPVADLVGAVLAEALSRAAQVTGEQPGIVMLTYPEQWGHALQQKLANAGEVAGIDLQRIRLVSEGAAAAGYYTATGADYPVGARVTVFDFGASHCGVAVLDKGPDGTFAVVAADGFEGLGGLDLEARIKTWALVQLSSVNVALAAEFSDTSNIPAQLRLAAGIRNAKEALSTADTAAIELIGAAGTASLPLTREEFDRLIAADIDRAIRLTESVLFQANTVRRVDEPVAIHLTGGSSRIPLIGTRLAALGPIHVYDDPKAVLTQGALSADPGPQQWQSIKLPDLPTPPKSRKERRLRDEAPAVREGKSRRRIRITKTMRRWAAGVALVAIVASGIGVAAVMIFGSIMSPKPSQQQASTPRSSLPAPTASVPTPVEFNVGVIVTEQTCAPDGVCTYKYTIEPKYVGLHPLPETPFTVFYEVVGGNEPQRGEFTVEKDQAKILKDVVLQGPPNAQLKANVMNVTG